MSNQRQWNTVEMSTLNDKATEINPYLVATVALELHVMCNETQVGARVSPWSHKVIRFCSDNGIPTLMARKLPTIELGQKTYYVESRLEVKDPDDCIDFKGLSALEQLTLIEALKGNVKVIEEFENGYTLFALTPDMKSNSRHGSDR